MPTDPLSELERQVLRGLVRSCFAEEPSDKTRMRPRLHDQPKAVAPIGEDICSYLRGIRRWIITKELASLLHCHPETIYKRIKTDDVPAHRDGNRWKYYPPEIADWLDEWSSKNPGQR